MYLKYTYNGYEIDIALNFYNIINTNLNFLLCILWNRTK